MDRYVGFFVLLFVYFLFFSCVCLSEMQKKMHIIIDFH